MPDTSTGVVVIGGGSTGAGVLRDLTLRGIDAILVEDGHLDPFYLVVGNVESARRRGARVMTHTEVVGFLRDGDRLTGVRIRDSKTNQEGSIACQSVINATGAWSGLVARLLGVEVKVVPGKGTMAVLARGLEHAGITRCHKPGDGDIVVPGLSVSIPGTTYGMVPHPQ